MKPRLVIDASAMVAMVRSEPEQEALERVLEQRKRAGVTLIAPTTLWLESVNSLVRRHRWTSAAVLEALHVIDAFGIEEAAVSRPLLFLALDLAERHGLTSYDACYLALAIAEDAELLTLDGDLAIAAGERAVALGDLPRLHETPTPYERDVTWASYAGAGAYLAQLRAQVLRDYDRPSPSAVPGPRR